MTLYQAELQLSILKAVPKGKNYVRPTNSISKRLLVTQVYTAEWGKTKKLLQPGGIM